MTRIGLLDRKHFRIEYLHPATNQGLIEMTIPNKPRSSKQKYRLAEKSGKGIQDTRFEVQN